MYTYVRNSPELLSVNTCLAGSLRRVSMLSSDAPTGREREPDATRVVSQEG